MLFRLTFFLLLSLYANLVAQTQAQTMIYKGEVTLITDQSPMANAEISSDDIGNDYVIKKKVVVAE